MKINTAIILCGGFGKRLNPLTLKKPKPLLQIKNHYFIKIQILKFLYQMLKRQDQEILFQHQAPQTS